MPISPEVTWPGPANSCPAQNSWPGPVHTYTLHRLTTLFTKRQRARGKIPVTRKENSTNADGLWQGKHSNPSYGLNFQNGVGLGDTQLIPTGWLLKWKEGFHWHHSSSKIRSENLEWFWRFVIQRLTTYRRGSGLSFTNLASKEPKFSRCLPRISHEPLEVCG